MRTDFEIFLDELEWALNFYSAEKALTHAVARTRELQRAQNEPDNDTDMSHTFPLDR